jgi:hypothetical protein
VKIETEDADKSDDNEESEPGTQAVAEPCNQGGRVKQEVFTSAEVDQLQRDAARQALFFGSEPSSSYTSDSSVSSSGLSASPASSFDDQLSPAEYLMEPAPAVCPEEEDAAPFSPQDEFLAQGFALPEEAPQEDFLAQGFALPNELMELAFLSEDEGMPYLEEDDAPFLRMLAWNSPF